MTESDEPIENEGSHYIPDIICPFCHQNVKQHKDGCVGKRFAHTAKDRKENSKRLRELYKTR